MMRDRPAVFAHRARVDRIRDVRCDDQADAGENRDRKHPQVPRHHERDEVVEGELGPLVKTAFERRETIEKDDGRREWQIESDDREDPENVLFVTKLRGPANPDRSDNKNDLSQHEVKQSEFFLEGRRCALQRRALVQQPLSNVLAHGGNNLMRCVIAFESDTAGSRGELFFVIANALWWVELVLFSCKVKNVKLRSVISVVRVPVAGNTSANTNHALQTSGCVNANR